MRFKHGDKVRFANRTQDSSEPMVINKIIGDKIYLVWDARPWSEGNLVLDSEWGPTVDKERQENALPAIEKGIPAPLKKPDQRRERKRSKWPAFLSSLEVGDSFLLEYPAVSTVKAHARSLGIPLAWRGEGKGPNNMAQERIWRVEPYDCEESE